MDQDGLKEKISDAFQRHFLHYGFKKTNVDEVAAELHISKKTIYEIFSCKEKIFEHVISRMAVERVKEMRLDLKKEKTYQGKIGRLVDNVFAHKREMLVNGKHQLKDKHQSEIAHSIFRRAFQDFAGELILNGFVKGEFHSNMHLHHLVPFVMSVVTEGISLQESHQHQNVEEDVKTAIFKLLECKHC